MVLQKWWNRLRKKDQISKLETEVSRLSLEYQKEINRGVDLKALLVAAEDIYSKDIKRLRRQWPAEVVRLFRATFAEEVKFLKLPQNSLMAPAPFTVVNFNSVPLQMEGEWKKYSLPAATDEVIAPDVFRVVWKWHGKERTGVGRVISECHVFGRVVGAFQYGGPGEVEAIRQAVAKSPLEIGAMLLSTYTLFFWQKITHQRGRNIRDFYGVVGFAGDVRQHDFLWTKLTADQNRQRAVEVPVFKFGQWMTIPFNWNRLLQGCFEGMETYAKAVEAKRIASNVSLAAFSAARVETDAAMEALKVAEIFNDPNEEDPPE